MANNCHTFVAVMLDESIELTKASLHRKDPVSEAIEQLLSADTRLVSVEHDGGWRAMLQFSSAKTALMAAGNFARRLIAAKRGGLPTRIGVASGESNPDDGPDDSTSQRAKWLASVAPKSGILVSRTTAALAQDLDLFPFWLVKHGDLFNLGQGRTEYIWALRHNELPELPGMPDEEEPKHNIPSVEEYFIGREAELEDIPVLFTNNRWVSLVGPSGLGKSMLSWRIAHMMVDEMRDGVRYVDLSGVTSQEEAVSRLFDSIGFKVDHLGKISLATIRSYFGNRSHLILFDGCERCLPALTKIIDSLLDTRGVRILTTTTKEFKHPAEVAVAVEPFSTPPDERNYSMEQLENFEATRAFIDRYRVDHEDFEPTSEESYQIAQICRVLGGHPLGINLAVGLLRSSSFSSVLTSVRQGTSGQNKSKKRKRHENLDEAVRWTVESLEPDACRLLETASVFEDLWSRDDIKEMMECEMQDIVKPLEEVLRTGMVMFDVESEAPECYRLLPHVRHAMRDSMKDKKDWPAIRERHFFRIYDKFAKRLPEIKGAKQAEHLDRLDAMRADFESALRYLVETNVSQNSFLMAMGQCWTYWYRRNRLSPIIALSDAAREKCPPTEPVNRARLDMLAAIFETKAGDAKSAQKRLRRALKTIDGLDELKTRAQILTNLGASLWADAESAKACKVLDEAIEIAYVTEERAILSPPLSTSVPPLLDMRRFDDAKSRLEKLKEISDASKDALIHWVYQLGLGEYFCEIRQYEQALEDIQRAIASAHKIGDPSCIGRSYLWRSQTLLRMERYEEAAEDLGRCLHLLGSGELALYKTNELRIIFIEGQLVKELGEPQLNFQKMYGALQAQLDTGKM